MDGGQNVCSRALRLLAWLRAAWAKFHGSCSCFALSRFDPAMWPLECIEQREGKVAELRISPSARTQRSMLIALLLPVLLLSSALGQKSDVPSGADEPSFVREIRSDSDVDVVRTPCQKMRDAFDPSGKARDVAGERAAVCDKILDTIAGKADPLPSSAKQPLHAVRITTDSQGRILLTEPDAGSVHILDFANRKYTLIDGRKDGRMLSPYGVAADAEDNVYLTDSKRGMIEVFRANGKFKKYIGNFHGEGAFQLPNSIAIDRPSGRIYLSDTSRHLVLILNHDGKELARIGKRGGGSGPGEFRLPTEIALHGQELFVLDKQNRRIQVFTLDGRFKREIHPEGMDAEMVRGMAIDTHGWIYLLLDLGFINVIDQKGEILFKFGHQGTEPGEFNNSQSIYIDSADRLYVTDTGNMRVQLFQIPSSPRRDNVSASR